MKAAILVLIGVLILTAIASQVAHSAPKRGFICVPAITPHLGPVRSKELT